MYKSYLMNIGQTSIQTFFFYYSISYNVFLGRILLFYFLDVIKKVLWVQKRGFVFKILILLSFLTLVVLLN